MNRWQRQKEKRTTQERFLFALQAIVDAYSTKTTCAESTFLMQRAIPALSATINQKTLITKSRNVRSKAKTMKKRKLSLSP